MATSGRITVAPAVLEWARTSAGLDRETATRRLGLSEEALSRWESGDLQPTIKQLRRCAAIYKRPLAVLLLPVPPTDFQPIRDFRQHSRAEPSGPAAWSPQLHAELKRAVSQREVFLELADLSPDSLPSGSKPELAHGTSAEQAGDYLRHLTGLDSFPSGAWADPREALNRCVDAVEDLGMIVVQTKGVATDEMRGFSISNWPFPVVALNGSEWPRPKLFTLFHELCHVALNDGGLCDLHETRSRRAPTDEVEHFCNAVAGVALMPTATALADPRIAQATERERWSLDDLADLSRRFGLSSEAILLRLITLRKATWDLYWERLPELQEAYARARDREREQRRESSGGPSFYVVKARDLGHGYASAVLDAFHSRAISSLDVADYLDVRFDQVPKLEAVLR